MIAPRDLAEVLKLHRVGHDWRGACPACGYRSGFVLSIKEGHAIGWCASCRDSGAIAAVLRRMGNGWSPSPAVLRRPAAGRVAERRGRALRLWSLAVPVPGTPAATYLAERRVPEGAASLALRFMPDCPHPNGGRWPALLALVSDMAGGPLGVHRTYLRKDGTGKAAVEPDKASKGTVAGGAIRLRPVASEIIVAEGIESALSASRVVGLPVAWAAISAGNLAHTLALPAEIRAVMIAADNDPPDAQGRRPGPDAAEAAARRWRAEGRRVRIAMPKQVGDDFNDLLVREAAHG